MCDSCHAAFRTAEVCLWSSSTGHHFIALLTEQLENQGAPASVPISLLPFQVYPPLPCCTPEGTHSPCWPLPAYPGASPTLPMAQDPVSATIFHHKASEEQLWPRPFFILLAPKCLRYLVSSPRKTGLTWLQCMSAFHFPFLHLLLKLLPYFKLDRETEVSSHYPNLFC